MAGHSKFKNIMHRKGAQDKKRAGLFAKLSKEIMIAAKMGGDDPDSNARLRLAIATARSNSMPKDNIQRAVQKGAGGGEADLMEEIRYEGYGPGGIAVLVDVMTDNRNRSAADVRAAFSKAGGNLGETGSVSFMFDRVGEIVFPAEVADEDTMFEEALEAGADEVVTGDEEHEILCQPEDLHEVAGVLGEKFGDPKACKLSWKPQNLVPVEAADKAESLLKFMDVLDDLDDVQNVTANFDISDEIMEKLAAS
ncbi:YebC/PmpR family DNA-binding transcriptional regulator [Curvivirga aplysinae]|uniref:YebC/PmpR family DNA-binding transcriptional regulator n=1 Tax=Curvivirga aplysinae TaxID=2529852 RepID=UPI0012BB6F0D|nr:YebC/PmpR family DNA-binding transcriptional regulator [Curvivirga aplysinae]MTI09127.1 YebC/PmpR family DNA-binding transcriptional regulator [Curvivirga aplysinae]